MPIWNNVADMSQRGFEAMITVPVIQSRMAQGDLQFSYSFNTSKILNLGYTVPAGLGFARAVGYPVNAVFGYTTSAIDTVGGVADGIIFSNEIHNNLPFHYLGVTDPPRTYTLTPTLALWKSRVRVSSVFDRQTGFILHNEFAQYCAIYVTCPAAFSRDTPVDVQARLYGTDEFDFYERGDFTRWRELNVTLDIPPKFLRIAPLHIGFSSASVSLQGRNLKLWTPYAGSDPESRQDANYVFTVHANGIPQPRSWSFRFDVTP
jgi:hypothetical protein